jgi:hypothetical protein
MKTALRPACHNPWLKRREDDMQARGRKSLSRQSLYEEPEGADRLRTRRILSCWGIARSGLDLKLGRGGEEKGPATKPFEIQAAMVSVIWAPNWNADGVLGVEREGSGLAQRGWAPWQME